MLLKKILSGQNNFNQILEFLWKFNIPFYIKDNSTNLLKIAHIFYSLEIGGVETLLVNIANWQISKGFNVTIILINDLYDIDLIKALDENIDVINLKRRLKSKNPFTIIKLNYFLFINRYDILHIHSAGIGNIILSFLKAKKVLHVHSTTFITNTRIPKFNKCIAISNSVKLS